MLADRIVIRLPPLILGGRDQQRLHLTSLGTGLFCDKHLTEHRLRKIGRASCRERV